MGKIAQKVYATTEKTADAYHGTDFAKGAAQASTLLQDVAAVATDTVVLSLAKAWIGLGLVKPAKTNEDDPTFGINLKKQQPNAVQEVNSATPIADRFDYKNVYHLALGEFIMPLSQTFDIKASKHLNTSHLVDGIDIIQQVQKEAKTISCTLRMAFNNDRENLSIVDAENEIQSLAKMLNSLYETNAVFAIGNTLINDTFGVSFVTMREYRFTPRAGSNVFTFTFDLTEVVYGDNVLTFDLSEVDAATNRQIVN